jgi:MFS family permease
VSAALVLIGAAAGAPAPLFGLYQQRFAVTDADLTASLAIYIAPAATALLMFGRLYNRIGRRPAGLMCVAFGIAGLLVLAGVHGVAVLLAGRALQGFATGSPCPPPASSSRRRPARCRAVAEAGGARVCGPRRLPPVAPSVLTAGVTGYATSVLTAEVISASAFLASAKYMFVLGST